ncbi:MAG: hypothetical protein LBQ59_03655 [Candidatus Peribacteria bacterium]|nr:hypothetical protein [Candidatus Peribacteria bacterium]
MYYELKTGKRTFEIEYFPKMSVDAVWEEAKRVFEKVFAFMPEKEDVIFIPKDKIE